MTPFRFALASKTLLEGKLWSFLEHIKVEPYQNDLLKIFSKHAAQLDKVRCIDVQCPDIGAVREHLRKVCGILFPRVTHCAIPSWIDLDLLQLLRPSILESMTFYVSNIRVLPHQSRGNGDASVFDQTSAHPWMQFLLKHTFPKLKHLDISSSCSTDAVKALFQAGHNFPSLESLSLGPHSHQPLAYFDHLRSFISRMPLKKLNFGAPRLLNDQNENESLRAPFLDNNDQVSSEKFQTLLSVPPTRVSYFENARLWHLANSSETESRDLFSLFEACYPKERHIDRLEAIAVRLSYGHIENIQLYPWALEQLQSILATDPGLFYGNKEAATSALIILSRLHSSWVSDAIPNLPVEAISQFKQGRQYVLDQILQIVPLKQYIHSSLEEEGRHVGGIVSPDCSGDFLTMIASMPTELKDKHREYVDVLVGSPKVYSIMVGCAGDKVPAALIAEYLQHPKFLELDQFYLFSREKLSTFLAMLPVTIRKTREEADPGASDALDHILRALERRSEAGMKIFLSQNANLEFLVDAVLSKRCGAVFYNAYDVVFRAGSLNLPFRSAAIRASLLGNLKLFLQSHVARFFRREWSDGDEARFCDMLWEHFLLKTRGNRDFFDASWAQVALEYFGNEVPVEYLHSLLEAPTQNYQVVVTINRLLELLPASSAARKDLEEAAKLNSVSNPNNVVAHGIGPLGGGFGFSGASVVPTGFGFGS